MAEVYQPDFLTNADQVIPHWLVKDGISKGEKIVIVESQIGDMAFGISFSILGSIFFLKKKIPYWNIVD